MLPTTNICPIMNLKSFVCVASVWVALGASSCMAGSQVDSNITDALARSGVGGSTYAKVSNAKKLGFDDILNLVSKGVPAHIVESYLQSTQAVYRFSPTQLASLKNAGAAPQLLNYLAETGGFYAPSQDQASGNTPRGEQKARYLNSPLYQDEQPFAYNAPEVDYWYNSAYEESLYSPFSFDAD